jgi:hypothetical protein
MWDLHNIAHYDKMNGLKKQIRDVLLIVAENWNSNVSGRTFHPTGPISQQILCLN